MNKKRFKKYLTKYQNAGTVCEPGKRYVASLDKCVDENIAMQMATQENDFNLSPNNQTPSLSDTNVGMYDSLNQDSFLPEEKGLLDSQEMDFKLSGMDVDLNKVKEDANRESSQFPSYTYDLPSAANFLGRSIKNKNAAGIATGGLKVLTGLGGNVMSGMGLANREKQVTEDITQKQKDAARGTNDMVYGEKGGEMQLPQQLTGEYVGEEQMMSKNAELEKGEYKQDNQGNVQEVVGETHEKGGVEMNLEEGEKILSDHLKVGKDLAKELRDSLEIKVKAADTYSDAMDKVKKSIGLEKIVKEQQQVIEKLSKLDSEDEDTQEINANFLKNKINELEQQKQPLQEKVKMMFDFLFQKQEESKVAEEKEEFFRDGGVMDTITKMSTDFNLPLEDTKDLYFEEYKKGGMIKRKDGSYSKPGLWDNIRANKGSGKKPTKEMLEQEKKIKSQEKEDGGYIYKDGGEQLPQYQDGDMFEKRVRSVLEESGYDGEDIIGKSGSIENVPEGQSKKILEDLGITVYGDVTAKDLLETVVNNPWYDWENFDGSRESALDFQEEYNSLVTEGYKLKPDGLFGEQTQTAKLPWESRQQTPNQNTQHQQREMSPEETAKASKTPTSGIPLDWKDPSRDKSIADRDPNDEIVWDPMTGKNRIKSLPSTPASSKSNITEPEKTTPSLSNTGVGMYGSLNQDSFLPEDGLLDNQELESKLSSMNLDWGNKKDGELDTDITTTEDKDKFISFADQFRLPPTGVQPHWMPNRTFDRVDPQQVSETPYFEQVNKMTDAQLRAIKDLPPAQQAAALASISASSTDSAAKTASQVELQNAQLRGQADQVNAQTQRMEENAGVQDKLSFEKRQLMALDNTQQDIKRYFDALNQDQLMKARQTGQINLLNDRYSDVAYTGDDTVEQTTDTEDFLKSLSPQQKDLFRNFLSQEEKKKKSKKPVAKHGGRFKKYKK